MCNLDPEAPSWVTFAWLCVAEPSQPHPLSGGNDADGAELSATVQPVLCADGGRTVGMQAIHSLASFAVFTASSFSHCCQLQSVLLSTAALRVIGAGGRSEVGARKEVPECSSCLSHPNFPFSPTPPAPPRGIARLDEVCVDGGGGYGCIRAQAPACSAEGDYTCLPGESHKNVPKQRDSVKPRRLAFKTISANICPSTHAGFCIIKTRLQNPTGHSLKTTHFQHYLQHGGVGRGDTLTPSQQPPRKDLGLFCSCCLLDGAGWGAGGGEAPNPRPQRGCRTGGNWGETASPLPSPPGPCWPQG